MGFIGDKNRGETKFAVRPFTSSFIIDNALQMRDFKCLDEIKQKASRRRLHDKIESRRDTYLPPNNDNGPCCRLQDPRKANEKNNHVGSYACVFQSLEDMPPAK